MADKFDSLIEAIRLRSEATDRFIQANTTAQQENARAIAQLGAKIDRLSETVNNQSASIERLERAVSKMVIGIEAQSENMKSFLALATRQADIISDLAKSRAS
ncbi:MAG: hypothetical protein AAFQ74_08630 [Cyanobacteria bacterium J06623_4]